jgi:hypothetical protein
MLKRGRVLDESDRDDCSAGSEPLQNSLREAWAQLLPSGERSGVLLQANKSPASGITWRLQGRRRGAKLANNDRITPETLMSTLQSLAPRIPASLDSVYNILSSVLACYGQDEMLLQFVRLPIEKPSVASCRSDIRAFAMHALSQRAT